MTMRSFLLSVLLTCIILVLCAFAVRGASGHYYNSPTGYASWWVEDDQTPPQALYEWQQEAGGGCVYEGIVNDEGGLASEFPGDPFNNLILTCPTFRDHHARVRRGDGESASNYSPFSPIQKHPLDLGPFGGLYSHLDKSHRGGWTDSEDGVAGWRPDMAPEGAHI